MVYPALLTLMHKPRLPVVDWTDAPRVIKCMPYICFRFEILVLGSRATNWNMLPCCLVDMYLPNICSHLPNDMVLYPKHFIHLQPFFSRRVAKFKKKRLLASSCLSVRMEQLGYHWMEFHEIWYLSIFRKKKIAEENLASLKSDKNNGYFTWRPTYIVDYISLCSS